MERLPARSSFLSGKYGYFGLIGSRSATQSHLDMGLATEGGGRIMLNQAHVGQPETADMRLLKLLSGEPYKNSRRIK